VFACIQVDPLFRISGIWLLVLGVVGFLVTGLDKVRAIGGEWRIPEVTLFIIALLGGALGMGAGMLLFHHKTSKPNFLVIFLPILVLWLAIIQQIGFLSCLGTALP
jgi:uncharacterized membrane protein YsdA (DUF1294 family)